MKPHLFFMLTAACLILNPAGCSQDDHDGHDHGNHQHDTESQPPAADHGHEHNGERHDLGTQEVDGHKISAAQIGKIEKDEATIEIKLADSRKGSIVVRVWIGVESGSGSVKSKAEYHADPAHDDYDAHAEVPANLPDGSAWWIELDTGSDTRPAVSFPVVK